MESSEGSYQEWPGVSLAEAAVLFPEEGSAVPCSAAAGGRPRRGEGPGGGWLLAASHGRKPHSALGLPAAGLTWQTVSVAPRGAGLPGSLSSPSPTFRTGGGAVHTAAP